MTKSVVGFTVMTVTSGVPLHGFFVDGRVQVSRALGDIVDKTGNSDLIDYVSKGVKPVPSPST